MQPSLKRYYTHAFPYNLLWQIICHGKNDVGKNREIGLWGRNYQEKDVLRRYCSYATAQEFYYAMKTVVPLKVEIGPIYTGKPTKQSFEEGKIVPLEKEFVIDIDINSYDKFRTCCKNEKICVRCWPFVSTAAVIIDECLRVDFGFEKLLWVFSGRRGMHCIMFDEKALTLDAEARESIVNFVSPARNSQFVPVVGKFVDIITHPTIERVMQQTLLRKFTDWYLPTQRPLSDVGLKTQTLSVFSRETRMAMEVRLNEMTNSSEQDKWQTVCQVATEKGEELFILGIVAAVLMPRVDKDVSVSTNHLIKCPFSVHPSTGRVSVPISRTDLETFDPMTVPTLNAVLVDIDEGSGSGRQGSVLTPYIHVLSDFVKNTGRNI